MVKTLIVDKNTCIGCKTCVILTPKTFKLGANGKAEVINPSSDEEGKIRKAIDSCPVGAIKWIP